MNNTFTFTRGLHVDHSNSVDNYLKDIAKYPILSADEQVELAIKAKAGDIEARNKLCACNQRFVYAIAKRYNAGNNTLDLVEEGNIGLFTAIDRFDPTKGYEFISYAVWYIKREINTFLINKGTLVKKTNNAKTAFVTSKVKNKFFCENGRFPSNDEIIEIFKKEFKLDIIDPNDIYDVESISINSKVDNSADSISFEESSEYLEKSSSYNEYEANVENEANNTLVENMLNTLKERDRQIVKMAYGIGYLKAYTNQEIAEELGFTNERIRQIKKSAEEKMRAAAKQFI